MFPDRTFQINVKLDVCKYCCSNIGTISAVFIGWINYGRNLIFRLHIGITVPTSTLLNLSYVFFLSFRSDIVSFYKDDVTTPYYAKGIFSYSGPELLDILVLNVDDERICVNRPLAVQENAAFVINRASLKSPDDWLQDDHGSFENKGHSGIIVTTTNEDGVYIERLPRRKQERQVLQQGQYLVKRTY